MTERKHVVNVDPLFAAVVRKNLDAGIVTVDELARAFDASRVTVERWADSATVPAKYLRGRVVEYIARRVLEKAGRR